MEKLGKIKQDTYSQNENNDYIADIFLLENFFTKCVNKPIKDGIFVELGALDGIKYSNTKMFENNLGFTGVLIEPSSSFNKLVKNRPNCKNYNYAVSSKELKFVEFFSYDDNNIDNGLRGAILEKIVECDAVSGMVHTMSESHKKGWQDEYKLPKTSIKVPCKRIDYILKDSDIKYIDLFSIDVEGGEFEVLETMDWSIPVYIIMIELDKSNLEKDEKCKEILRNQGFIFLMKKGLDEFWINNNYYRKHLFSDEDFSSVNGEFFNYNTEERESFKDFGIKFN
jgi:FkbM family methyltransferase